MEDGGSLRGLATGTVFDLTGQASLRWTKAAGERPGAAGVPPAPGAVGVGGRAGRARGGAGARAAGAWAACWRRCRTRASRPTCATTSGRPTWQRPGPAPGTGRPASSASSPSATAAAGCPPRAQVVRRPTFDSFFAAADGGGLADRTQRRFFSDGTVPEDVPVDESHHPARGGRGRPRVAGSIPAPDRGPPGSARRREPRYLMIEGRRALGYEWIPGPRALLPGRAGVQRRRPGAAARGGGLRRGAGRAPAARQPDPDRGRTVRSAGAPWRASRGARPTAGCSCSPRMAVGAGSLAGDAARPAGPAASPPARCSRCPPRRGRRRWRRCWWAVTRPVSWWRSARSRCRSASPLPAARRTLTLTLSRLRRARANTQWGRGTRYG